MSTTEIPQDLTPAMRGVLQRIARAGMPAWYTMTPQQARAGYRAAAEVLDLPRTALPRVQDVTVPGPAGDLPGRLYAPSNARLPALLYLHGGGFTIGGLETHDSLCRQLALGGQCAVLSLDYRLAPEHPFPAAQDDAWAALRWLHELGARQLGLDPTRLAVGGDSAGGTLAAVSAIRARDAGLPLALQLLFYPGTTGHQDTASHQRYARGYLLEQAHIDWFFGQHITEPAQRDDWRFAPLYAADLEGVAPAWVGLAECDPLVDEGVAYADRLRMARVPVDLEIWRGVTHDFIKMGRAIPEARLAHAAAGRALQLAFEETLVP